MAISNGTGYELRFSQAMVIGSKRSEKILLPEPLVLPDERTKAAFKAKNKRLGRDPLVHTNLSLHALVPLMNVGFCSAGNI